MDQFPGNSHTSRIEKNDQEPAKAETTSEPNKVGKIVTGKVTERPKSLGAKFKDMFVTDGSSFSEYIVDRVIHKVIIPKAKETLDTIVTQALEGIAQGFKDALHGEGDRPVDRRRTTTFGNGNTRVAYHNMSSRTTIRRSDDRPPQGVIRRSNRVKDIIVETRDDGDLVLEELDAMIDTMGHCTVGDYYSLVGETPRSTDQEWGWTTLSEARVNRLSADEFLISMPRPRPIES